MFFFPSFSLAHLSSLLCAARYVCVSVMRRVLRCACGQWCGSVFCDALRCGASCQNWGERGWVANLLVLVLFLSLMSSVLSLMMSFSLTFSSSPFFVRKKTDFFLMCVDFCVHRCGVLRSGFEDPLWTLLEFEWNMSVISKNDFTSWLGDVTLYLWGRLSYIWLSSTGKPVHTHISTVSQHAERLTEVNLSSEWEAVLIRLYSCSIWTILQLNWR